MIVRTLGGRAVKVEGSPNHPINQGAMCARGQASLQQLYNPGRIRFPMYRGSRSKELANTDWESAMGIITNAVSAHRGKLAILADGMEYGQSPAMVSLLTSFTDQLSVQPLYFSLLDGSSWKSVSKNVHGKSGIPLYKIDEADVILAFSANFLEAWPSPLYYGRAFGEFRQGKHRKQGEHGRFIYVGPRMSMTAAKADVWLPCKAGTEGVVAQGILGALGKSSMTVAQAAAISGLSTQQIDQAANQFAAAGPKAVAMAGDGLVSQVNAVEAISAVEHLNAINGAALVGIGDYLLSIHSSEISYFSQIQHLQQLAKSGDVGALLILGRPNPIFALPKSAGFAETLSLIPFVAALTPFADETSQYADLVLPTGTFLEEWGDANPAAIPSGARVSGICQPIVDTKYVTLSDLKTPWMSPRPAAQILTTVLGAGAKQNSTLNAEEWVRSAWRASDDVQWNKIVSEGGQWSSQPAEQTVLSDAAFSDTVSPSVTPGAKEFSLVLYPHIYWTDGRNSNVPWLQEITDPMTMAVWNNWIEINPASAHALGIRTGDIVRLTTDFGSMELPAVPYPAIHPECVAVPIGQGSYDFGGGLASGHDIPNPLSILPLSTDNSGALAYGTSVVRVTKVRDAASGYHPEANTLVILQDRPGGQEPEAVQDLIHTTAKEWRQEKAQTAGSQG
jgi:molybdopterin-containing oxidoreductase family iron-sulfur binding subunit